MSADAAAAPQPETKVEDVPTEGIKSEEVKAESSSAPAQAPHRGKTMVAALPKEQPAGIPDEVVSAAILDEAPPAREGKTEDEVRELAANAAQLIAFYFSDSNLPNDRFLFTLTACNEPMYGWVPISVLASFSRMRALGLDAVDVPFVAWAIRRRIAQEKEDPLLAISEDGVNVRRKRVVEKDGADLWSRSAYVKGFGERGEEDEKTQEAIEKYMRQFGLINSVRLRREDAGKGGKDKGKGKFKGSIFAEFAALEDLQNFIKRESIPKFAEEGPEMEFKTKEEYCLAKAKEKNIPESQVMYNRSAEGNRASGTGANGAPGKFNGNAQPFSAFRELSNLQSGRRANLAIIQETTPIVGKRITQPTGQVGNGAGRDKRKREDEVDGDKKRVHSTEPLELKYKDVTLKIDRETGKVLDKTQVPFEENSMVMFKGEGENSDWKVLKEDIIKVIPKPFLAAPPGSGGGKLAKADSTAITDDELKQLQDARMKHGDVEIVWSRPSTEEMQDFWATRASFQGGALAKKTREEEHEREVKEQASARDSRGGDRRNGGGRDRDGGRGGGRGGGGRGRGGRGGGRGGNRGGNRGGDRGGRGEREGGGNGLPPTLGSA